MTLSELSEMTIIELKSLAYDFLVQREQIIQNLHTINGLIAQKSEADKAMAES